MEATPELGRLLDLIRSDDASVRLKTVMALGTAAPAEVLPALIERCAVEPDFYVREALTWAIIRLPRALTVPALQAELDSASPQARSQALHTLSKIGVPEAWTWAFPHLVRDDDDEVARAAWRVAVGTVPDGHEKELADLLVQQFGRGDLETQKSLARALVELSQRDGAVIDIVERSVNRVPYDIRPQVRATLTVLHDPGASFAGALAKASRA